MGARLAPFGAPKDGSKFPVESARDLVRGDSAAGARLRELGMPVTLRSKINAGFSLALVLLLAISAISYQKISALASNNEWIIHTHEVLEKIQSVTSGLLTIQTEGRGYLLTGQALYIEQYRSGITTAVKRSAVA